MRQKTWSQTFIGGGCTVTLSGPCTNTKNDRKCTKNTFEKLFIIFPQNRNIFIGIIEFPAPKNICIHTNFVILTALELKLWHKT